MKIKILIAFFLSLFSFAVNAQLNEQSLGGNVNTLNTVQGGFWPKLYSVIPKKDTLNNAAMRYVGAITIRPQDTLTHGIPTIYISTGTYWTPIAGGSTGVGIDSITSPSPYNLYIAWSGGNPVFTFPTFLKKAYGNYPILVDSTGVDSIRIGCATCDAALTKLLSGGVVSYAGTGYSYNVTRATDVINGIGYSYLAGTVTLGAADPSNDRIDAIALDTLNAIIVVPGTAAANPAQPQVLPNQLLLTYVTVKAGTTAPPGVTQTIIYDEQNAGEWGAAVAGSGFTSVFSNTTNPFHLTKAANVSAWTGTSAITFTSPTKLDRNNYTLLKLYIYDKAPIATSANIQVYFLDGTTVRTNALSLTSAQGFDKNGVGYQNVTLNLSSIPFTGNSFDKLIVRFTGAGGGVYLDYVQLQGGVVQGSDRGVLFYGKNTTRDSSIIILNDGTRFAAKDSAGGTGGYNYGLDSTYTAADSSKQYFIYHSGRVDSLRIVGNVGTVTQVNAITLGTTGTDLSSTVANSTSTPTITLQVPSASASNRGVLTSTDWSTFNSKQSALSGTGYSKWSGASVSYLTPTQVTADLNLFTTTLKGLVPPPTTVTGKVLSDNGTWITAGSGSALYGGYGIKKLADSTTLVADSSSAGLSGKYFRISDTTGKWVQFTGLNSTGDSMYVVKNGTRTAQKIAAGAAAWLLTGNPGIDTTLNFLGTTDNRKLRFGVNNKLSGFIDSSFRNTSLGYLSLSQITPDYTYATSAGTQNVALGFQAADSMTTGQTNMAIGGQALFRNKVGSGNVAVGNAALKNWLGQQTVAIGSNALLNATNGGGNNVAIGFEALKSATTADLNTAIGKGALQSNLTGQANTAVGADALLSTTGGNNTALGEQSGYSNTSGFQNTFLGFNAGYFNTTGSEDTYIGYATNQTQSSGSYNVSIGNRARVSTSGGDQNTALGYMSNGNGGNGSGGVFLGFNAGLNETNSNRLYISNTSTASPLIFGDFSNVRLGIGLAGTTASLQLQPGKTSASSAPIKFTNTYLTTTATSGTGSAQTFTFATQPFPPFAVGSSIIVVGITPSGYNGTWTVTSCTTSSVTTGGSTTGSQTVAGTILQGALLTTPERGALEYDGKNAYLTDSTGTRYTLAKTLTATATLDFTSTAAGNSSDLTISLTGAADGDAISLGAPNGSMNANSSFVAFVSASGTVTVRFINSQVAGSIDPASGTFRVSVIKY